MAKDITKLKHRFPRLRNLLTAIHRIPSHWPLFLLLAIVIILSFLNYQPGTWLTGWDNLHPEFNFPVNIKRSIFAVWQEYQGLGLLGGMAHAADLPRIIFLNFLSIFHYPLSIYRYFWTFLMLTLGPVGVYFLLHHLFLKPKFDPQTKKIASFLGALFYLLNLATIQYFFIPFEAFSAFFAFFPLLILATTLYLEKPSTGHYFFLLTVFLISAPAFFVQTLFVVLAVCLVPILTSHIRRGKKKIIVLLLTLLATQGYWLLPQIFFVATHAKEVGLSHANLLSSPETLYRNLQFANLQGLALLKGFWFNILDPGADNKFDYLFLVWRNHLNNPTIAVIGYLSFALVLTGIIYSLKKKLPFAKPFLVIFLICNFFLLGGVGIVGDKIPLFSELFRSPFTKFSIPLAFTYSLFFSVGVIFLLDLFSFLHSRLTYYLTLFTVSLALVIFMTPAFTGNLISPQMRVKIPNEYFQLFDFFNKQDPATRIANFPQYTFWGWNYYSWGYRGSGFLWYGIRQPILDRAFDVWEKSSEKYYEEVTAAIYGENQAEFENLVDKYAINWILIDKNIIAANTKLDLGLTKLQKFLDNSSRFSLAKNINDKILIYKTDVDKDVKNFLSVSQTPPPSPQPFSDSSLRPISFVIPAKTGIYTDKSPIKLGMTDGQIILRYEQRAMSNEQLFIPSYTETENLIPTTLAYRKTALGLQLKFEPVLPEIKINDQLDNLGGYPTYLDFSLPEDSSGLILGINDHYLEVQLPDELTIQSSFYPLTNLYLPSRESSRVSVYSNTPAFKLDLTSALSQATPAQCYTAKPNRKIEKIVAAKTISLFGIDLVGCLSAPIPTAGVNQLISLEFTYQSATGTPANANITNRSFGGETSPQPITAQKTPTFSRVFAKPLLEPLQANLILEANETKSTQEIIYQNVAVSYLPLLGETSFIPNSVPGNSITATEGSILSVSIPLLDTPYTVTAPAENMNSEARNCDNFNQGEFTRQITDSGFLYTSLNANSCDQINLKHLPHGLNYALIFDAQNHRGLSPTVCLENHATRRCDIFERLINGRQLILQPIVNNNEPPGYTLHLFNQSFGSRPTENLIRSITITPFPLNFLKNITLTGFSSVKPVMSSTHPAEFLYTTDISWDGDASTDDGSSQVISLYQTKSPYWKALVVSEDDLKLPLWLLIAKLPYMYLKQHVIPANLSSSRTRVADPEYPLGGSIYIDSHFRGNDNTIESGMTDDWYNSWSLSPGPHHLVIFYFPQYLEFLGFVILPLPLLGSLIYILFHKKSPV